MADKDGSHVLLKKFLFLIVPSIEVIYGLPCAMLVFLIFLNDPINIYAQSCKVEKDEDQIKVESCTLSGTNFRLIRGETKLKGTLVSAIDLLNDSTSCTKLRSRCISERIIRQISQYDIVTESVSYGKKLAGYTIAADRISVVRRTLGFIHAEDAVLVTIIGDDIEMVDSPGMVRVKCIRGQWIIRREPNDMVDIKYEIVSNPDAPALFVNGETVESVREMLKNMRLVLQNPPYSNAINLPRDIPSVQSVTDIGNSFSQCIQRGR